MITKDMFAEILIDEFIRNNDIPDSRRGLASLAKMVWDEDVFQSRLGLAIEQLAPFLLSPMAKTLVEGVAGRALTYTDPVNKVIHILTIREVFDLLPETLESDNQEG